MANNIHPSAFVGPEVSLGSGNIIGPGSVIIGPCEIGNNNWIGPYAVIGTPGEYQGQIHSDSWSTGSGGLVTIGSRNTIREFVTVHVSIGTETRIGNDCYVMSKSHIPHDAVIEDEAKLGTAVLLGGFVHIGKAAYLGFGSIVHQRLVIGSGAMVGMGSVVTRHVPPLSKSFGSPAKNQGLNLAKVDAFGVSEADVDLLSLAYKVNKLPRIENLSTITKAILVQFDLNVSKLELN